MHLRRADYVCLSSTWGWSCDTASIRFAALSGFFVKEKFTGVPAAEHSDARTCQHVHLHLQTFSYESGIKHLPVVTAAALPEQDVNVCRDTEGGREEGWPVGKWNQIGRDRRKDDQINHMGHFFSVQKGLIYTPTLGSHDQKANLSVAGRNIFTQTLAGRENCVKWRQMLVIVGPGCVL